MRKEGGKGEETRKEVMREKEKEKKKRGTRKDRWETPEKQSRDK